MRCLFVQQPYASEIAYGHKVEEYRPWNWKYRGPLLICASRNPEICTPKGPLPVGVALAVVDLVDVRYLGPDDFAFVLTNPRQVEPVAIKGQVKPFEYSGPELIPTTDHLVAYWNLKGEAACARAVAKSKAAGKMITFMPEAGATTARVPMASRKETSARAITRDDKSARKEQQIARRKRAAFNRWHSGRS